MMPNMMGGMMPAVVMMCQMTCTMTPTGMKCEMMPMDDSMKDMYLECCQRMMACMTAGMPAMITCGGMTMMCAMPAKAAKA
jgi:hypothetical protein